MLSNRVSMLVINKIDFRLGDEKLFQWRSVIQSLSDVFALNLAQRYFYSFCEWWLVFIFLRTATTPFLTVSKYLCIDWSSAFLLWLLTFGLIIKRETWHSTYCRVFAIDTLFGLSNFIENYVWILNFFNLSLLFTFSQLLYLLFFSLFVFTTSFNAFDDAIDRGLIFLFDVIEATFFTVIFHSIVLGLYFIILLLNFHHFTPSFLHLLHDLFAVQLRILLLQIASCLLREEDEWAEWTLWSINPISLRITLVKHLFLACKFKVWTHFIYLNSDVIRFNWLWIIWTFNFFSGSGFFCRKNQRWNIVFLKKAVWLFLCACIWWLKIYPLWALEPDLFLSNKISCDITELFSIS